MLHCCGNSTRDPLALHPFTLSIRSVRCIPLVVNQNKCIKYGALMPFCGSVFLYEKVFWNESKFATKQRLPEHQSNQENGEYSAGKGSKEQYHM